ncbi:MAG: GIY-YIG nuclease family protein [Planctomycetes bacterium]|nr:GIY-YIG nuclease family protein [Planctomycetota bacterium]
MPFHVYILQNHVGKFYTGHTDDLTRRLGEHNSADGPLTKYTLKNGPSRLVWSEQHTTRSEAIGRERQIKAMKSARWIREELLNW